MIRTTHNGLWSNAHTSTCVDTQTNTYVPCKVHAMMSSDDSARVIGSMLSFTSVSIRLKSKQWVAATMTCSEHPVRGIAPDLRRQVTVVVVVVTWHSTTRLVMLSALVVMVVLVVGVAVSATYTSSDHRAVDVPRQRV